MSLAYEPPPSAGDGPRVVPFAEYQRERAGRIEAQEKLSAVAAIIQDPQLQHSEARTRAAVVLALEAQRPADNPTRPFRLDLGTLAKHAGLVPPTPEGDEKKRAAAYKAGRKVAGQVVKDLAGGGAIADRWVEKERTQHGDVVGADVVIRIDRPHIEVIRAAGRLEGTRGLQQARHHNGSRPYCRDCGPDAPVIERKTVRCVCGRCGQPLTEPVTTERQLPPEAPVPETGPAEPTGFQPLETHSTESTQGVEEAVSTGFQRLETGASEETPAGIRGQSPLGSIRPPCAHC